MKENASLPVLVVDDDPLIRDSLAAFLDQLGFATRSAADGAQALEIVRSSPPALVLTDLRMPIMDGWALLAALAVEFPALPTVAVSGVGRIEEAMEAVRLGAWDYVTKPIRDLHFLSVVVQRVLERARLLEENRRYREHLEEEVRLRTAELEAARDKAQAADRAKTEFLANMSHEIRTPLNGVMGMLQVLRFSPLDDEQQMSVDVAMESCRRLLALLSDLLDLSRIEADRMDIRREPFTPARILATVAETFGKACRDKGLELLVREEEGLDAELLGDEVRVRQILHNLVGNAVKFTDKGRVAVQAFTVPLPDAQGVRLVFRVTDTGIGMPEDQIGPLFDRFAQAEHSYRRTFQGAGLGLSISARLARIMGGGICLSSRPGEGAEAVADIRVQASPVRSGECRGLPLRVLLADDDPVSLLAVGRLLEHCGHTVASAEDGRKALDLICAQDFDLAVLDVRMPVMDGVDVARAVRSGQAGKDRADLPLLALTVYARDKERDACIQAGMDEFVAKPVTLAELEAKLYAVAAARPRRRTP